MPPEKNSAAPTALSPIQQKNQNNWILNYRSVKITLSPGKSNRALPKKWVKPALSFRQRGWLRVPIHRW